MGVKQVYRCLPINRYSCSMTSVTQHIFIFVVVGLIATMPCKAHKYRRYFNHETNARSDIPLEPTAPLRVVRRCTNLFLLSQMLNKECSSIRQLTRHDAVKNEGGTETHFVDKDL